MTTTLQEKERRECKKFIEQKLVNAEKKAHFHK